MPEADVVDLLLQQHTEVRELFARLLEGQGSQEDWDTLLRLLAVHETAEEEVVYPALRAIGDEGRAVAKARQAEEDQAKKDLSELEAIGFDGPEFALKLATFHRAVKEHASAEEREVFPLLRDRLEPGTLEAMRPALKAAEAMAPTHPHPHAPESAVGNLVTGPVVALMDRVRDAIRSLTK